MSTATPRTADAAVRCPAHKHTRAERTAFVQAYNPSEFDVNGISNLLYRDAANRGASSRVQLAQFETAIVESHINNLPGGDCDSVGVFQQRPSQGWCAVDFECLDIRHAHNEFLNRAIDVDSRYSGLTAGQLAQKVQRSAFPTRYDQQAANARRAIADTTARVAAMSQTGSISGSPHRGYWSVEANGTVHNKAGAPFFGDMRGKPLAGRMVGVAARPTGRGYWLVGEDGGVFSFGDAPFYGSMGGKPLQKPVVGIAPTPTGAGYWLVAADGGVFTFGDAKFYGSMGGQALQKPVVGIAATPSGAGYWLVAADGGVFSFGDAPFYGSMGGKPLQQPVVGMAATPNGAGYWLVASDGGIFTFGNAGFYGSGASAPVAHPVTGMAATVDGGGYWLVESDGQTVLAFGNAPAPSRRSDGRGRTARLDDAAEPYSAAVVSIEGWDADQAPRDLKHLTPGERVEVVVTVRNDGSDTWMPVGEHPTRLVTAAPAGHSSPFVVDGEWLSPSEPTGVAATTAPPGSTVSFSFPIVAPQTTGDYSETFNLVHKGLAAFNTPDFAVPFHVVRSSSGGADRAAILARLRALLRQPRHPSRHVLLRSGGFRATFVAPTPGLLRLQWSLAGHRSAKGSAAQRRRIATGRARVSAAGRMVIRVRLTAAGRRVLRSRRRPKVQATAAFQPVGAAAVQARRSFRIKTSGR